jgi:hypothetical protein
MKPDGVMNFPTGIPVYMTDMLTDRISTIDYDRPKRRHRKRLIAKRWAKRFGYHTKIIETERPPMMINGILYVGPKAFQELKKIRHDH